MSHNVSTVALDRRVLATFHCLLLHWLPGKHTRAGVAGRGTALRDWYIHGEQAGMDTRQWIGYINHSKTNTCRHLYRVKANICLAFVFMLTIVTGFFFASCFNICSDVFHGHHDHGASSDYGWRRRSVDMDVRCVCFQYTDANNWRGAFCDSVFKELRE